MSQKKAFLFISILFFDGKLTNKMLEQSATLMQNANPCKIECHLTSPKNNK
jgi:hypothetical protein